MRLFIVSSAMLASLLCSGCAFYVRQVEPSRYTVKILYSNESFIGAALTGQSVLVLPVLTREGPDTVLFFNPLEVSRLLGEVRGDLVFAYPQTFEKKYRSTETGSDGTSLNRFYASLFQGKTLDIQTSDSVWKAVDADYLLAVRMKYAATIRGFDGNASRRLVMEVELWSVAAAEAVWRAEVVGLDKRPDITDGQFVAGAMKEVFGAFPGYVPANNEKDW